MMLLSVHHAWYINLDIILYPVFVVKLICSLDTISFKENSKLIGVLLCEV
jgi:hypothetical protein